MSISKKVLQNMLHHQNPLHYLHDGVMASIRDLDNFNKTVLTVTCMRYCSVLSFLKKTSYQGGHCLLLGTALAFLQHFCDDRLM